MLKAVPQATGQTSAGFGGTIPGMSPLLRSSLLIGLACLLSVPTVHAQSTDAPKLLPEMDFSKDPCGDPRLENDLWYEIHGKVTDVVDGYVMVQTQSEHPQLLRVELVGIALEQSGPFRRRAIERLSEMVRGKRVEVVTKTGNLGFSGRIKPRITGVVQFAPGSVFDVGLTLLDEGLARFKKPPPYSMSWHTKCEYRRAEAQARSNKLGLWH